MGAGKTSVAEYLAAQGAQVIDADQVAREVVKPGSSVLEKIRERFGQGVVRPDGTLDRAALARVVFHRRSRLRDLESIIHPPILARIRERIASRRSGQLVVVDAPLLIETGLDRDMDQIWMVGAPEEICLERLAHRGISPSEARKRMARQMPVEQKARLAHVIIDNSGSWSETTRQINRALEEIQGK